MFSTFFLDSVLNAVLRAFELLIIFANRVESSISLTLIDQLFPCVIVGKRSSVSNHKQEVFGPSDCYVQPFFVGHKAQAFDYAPIFSHPFLLEFIVDFVAADAVEDYDLFLLSLKGINSVDGVVPIAFEIQTFTCGFQLFDLSLVRSNDCNSAFKLLDILSAEFCQVLN